MRTINFIFWQYSSFPKDIPDCEVGGAETAIWEIGKRLVDKYRVRIFCISNEKYHKKVDNINFYWIAPIIKNKWIKPDLYFKKCFKKIKKDEIVVAVNCIEPALWHRNNLFLHLENDLDPYMPFPKIKAKFYLKFLKRFKIVSGVSNYTINRFIRKFNFPRKKTKVIHNGADILFFTPEKRSSELRKKHNIGENDKVIIFSGRINKRKGLHLAINAIKNTEIKMFVAGTMQPSKNKDDIKYYNLIKKSLTPNIIMLGGVDKKKLAEYYASSDICVLPSIWKDPCPLVAAEAQASGLPVIGFNYGGIPEIIIDEKTGFICKPAELKEKILYLFKNNEKLQEFSRNARDYALNNLNWDDIVKKFSEIYEK